MVVAGTAGTGACAAGGATLDSADDDSVSESDCEELPELGLFEPIGERGLKYI